MTIDRGHGARGGQRRVGLIARGVRAHHVVTVTNLNLGHRGLDDVIIVLMTKATVY